MHWGKILMVLIRETLRSVPVVGQANAFVNLAKNLTNTTDLEGALLGAVQILKEECFPPLKLSVECAMLIMEIVAAVSFATNPVTGTFSLFLFIGSGTRVLMRRL
jgi:hypothetical protein